MFLGGSSGGGANCLDYVKEGAQLHYDDYVLQTMSSIES